jgi:hypothetical protein
MNYAHRRSAISTHVDIKFFLLRSLIMCSLFFPIWSTWAADHTPPPHDSNPPAAREAVFPGDRSQEANPNPHSDGYKKTEFKIGTDQAGAGDAWVPGKTYFKYDAFGRIIEKQVFLE